MALSDPTGILASPLTIVDRGDEQLALEAILAIIDRHQVGHIIVGLPLSMDGGIGQQAAKVKAFVGILSRRVRVPIEFRDESLTTVEARRIMLTSRSKKNRQKSRDDDVAAAVLLQGYLEEAANNQQISYPDI